MLINNSSAMYGQLMVISQTTIKSNNYILFYLKKTVSHWTITKKSSKRELCKYSKEAFDWMNILGLH